MVLAFTGDSTMTKLSAQSLFPLQIELLKINDKRLILYLSTF